jgi:hypothetical protein
MCSTSPPATSVASSRETVLGLTPGAACDLVRSQLAVRVRERVDHGERALHRADEADRWLSRPRHRS